MIRHRALRTLQVHELKHPLEEQLRVVEELIRAISAVEDDDSCLQDLAAVLSPVYKVQTLVRACNAEERQCHSWPRFPKYWLLRLIIALEPSACCHVCY